MKRTVLCLALLGLLALGGQAQALICTIDDVPAATLLLPYFEVDLSDTNGINTLFSVNNASATAVLAHVTVWSDLSVPILDFNIYLTGYDVQTVSMRNLLNGILPRTASVGQDPGDTISPQGDFSQDINFASCNGQLPINNAPPELAASWQAALTGQRATHLTCASGNCCAGLDFEDNIARGYITVDTVNNCTLRFPSDPGYFVAGGVGDATNQNVLWGDYFYVNPAQNFAQGETLVHVEADALDPETSVPGEYTFYGRYVAWTAADNREPLATSFATRFINGGDFTGGTDLLVWRDAKVNQQAFTCGTVPSWFPLGQEGVVIFDEQETPNRPPGCQISPCTVITQTPFPAETQRVSVGGESFPVPFNFGWLYLDLNFDSGSVNPPEDPLAQQAWVTTVMDADGRFSVGFDAIQLDSACNASHGVPGLFPG
jgi:hypothetical protein